jgi:hypothetical protein
VVEQKRRKKKRAMELELKKKKKKKKLRLWRRLELGTSGLPRSDLRRRR